MRPLSEQHVYTSSIRTWPSAWQISQHFFRTRGKVFKEVKTIRNRVTLRAAASQRGSQVPWLSEEGKCYDASYATAVVVFIITYFHKPIHQLFDDKHRLSSHEKLSFKLMNIICVIQGKSQTGSKNKFPFPTDYCTYFFRMKVPWGPLEGAGLRHSLVST